MAEFYLTCRAVLHGGSGTDIEDPQIPSSLKQIHDYFDKNNDQKGGKATCKMYSKHLRANFCPINVPALEEILASMDDIDAESVEVTGFQYQNSNLPSVNAFAVFKVPFKKKWTNDELSEWESDKDDPVGFCVNFWWEFEDLEDEDWESYLDDNSGVDFYIMD